MTQSVSQRAAYTQPGNPILIGPTDPPPFERLNPDGNASVLLICDHASNVIPAAMDNLGLDPSLLKEHIAWDIGAAEVTRRLSDKLNAQAVLAGYSRLVIDNNRQPGDPSSIPATSDETAVPGNRNLEETDQIARTDSFFWPYHHAVADGLAHLWRTGTPPALLSVHSFTPSFGGEDRPWHIGVLWNRDPRMAEPLIHELRKRPEGFPVGDNQPYSGKLLAYSLDFHAGAAGLPHCAVEIRQDLLASDQDCENWATVLAETLALVLAIPDLHKVVHY